jgi:hypothetical protein
MKQVWQHLDRESSDMTAALEVFIKRAVTPAMCVLFMTLTACRQPNQASSEWSLTSPDGRLTISVTRHAEGRLTWHVTRGGSEILGASPLGVRRTDQTFIDALTLVEARRATNVDEIYEIPYGKRWRHFVHGRERVLTFANAANARIDVVLRAHDDGVAFRYRFPETDAAPKRIAEELTGFQVPAGSTGWIMPYQEPGKYGPAYEKFFEEVPAGKTSPTPVGWAFPALFKTPAGKWLLLHESALDEHYAGMHLAAEAPDGVYRLHLPEPAEGNRVGQVEPQSTLPWTLPWRVVIVGDAATNILESDLVLDLSPPSRVKDLSWIKSGVVSWSWWSASDSPKKAADLNTFVDLAGDMGWTYSLVDANWDRMKSGRIEDVIAHAKKRNIGLLLWYNSGGPHNDVTEAPRDRMLTRDVRRAEFARLQQWGIKGVKVDFWQSDKQDRIRQYRELLEDAAEFRLLVDLHGCTIPRGWSREFPHLMTMEAVMGAEQYKFNEEFPKRAAAHNTILPFTRNVVGSMDYTPVTFSDQKFPHLTTSAHELALAFVFESGLQHLADSAASYRALPKEVQEVLRLTELPWWEMRGLSGEPGRSVVVARNAGDVWVIAGLNGLDTPQTLKVPLSFLPPASVDYKWSLITDGKSDRTFDTQNGQRDGKIVSSGSFTIPVRGRGGFVLWIGP